MVHHDCRLVAFLLFVGSLPLIAAPSMSTDSIQAPHHQSTAAVLPLSAQGVDSTTVSVLTDALANELYKSGTMQVMERSQMSTILKEQGFQQSGFCDQSECALQMGKLLGIEQIVVGSVGKIGNTYTVSLRLVSVHTGEILASSTKIQRGLIDDLLSQTIPLATKELIGKNITSEPEQGKADLFVTTDPPGSTLEIDGILLNNKRTPCMLDAISSGEHIIKFTNGSFIGKDTVSLKDGELRKIVVHLFPNFGHLKVISTPPGAKVWLDDNNYLGETPLLFDQVSPGIHELRAESDGYISSKMTVQISTSKTANLHLALTALPQIEKVSVATTVVPTAETPKPHTRSGTSILVRWVSGAGAIIAGGVASYYLKCASDYSKNANSAKVSYALVSSNFSQYKTNYLNAENANHEALDHAKVAGIVSGILAVGFGLSFAF